MTDADLARRLEKLERQNQRLKYGAVLCLLSITLIAVMGESGCPQDQPQQVSSPAPIIVRPYQRFLPIATPLRNVIGLPVDWELYWALDTKTGQVCRTWDWSFSGDKPGKGGAEDINLASPTCYSLYLKYPDGK